MEHEKSGHKLFLIWGAQGKESLKANQESAMKSMSVQLDLFPSDRPDALIFTTVTRRDFERISDLLRHCHARFILDLRELPSLAFDRANRDRFFELLTKYGVTYEHVDELIGEKSVDHSISVFLEQLATGTQLPQNDQLRGQLKRLIENGPTLVFTDTSPEKDEAATYFAKSLEQSKIKFSPVFTVEERSGAKVDLSQSRQIPQ